MRGPHKIVADHFTVSLLRVEGESLIKLLAIALWHLPDATALSKSRYGIWALGLFAAGKKRESSNYTFDENPPPKGSSIFPATPMNINGK